MKKDGYSRPGFFGTINHYDASGKKVGESRPGFFGGMNNYDANGHKVGHSSPIKNATAKKVSWADIIIMRSNGDDNYDFDKS